MRTARLVTRLPLALCALAALASAVAIGLARLGVALPLAAPYADAHGTLMICGFFGAVIGLERATALGSGWALLAPAGAAAGVLALLARAPQEAAALGFALGAAGLTAVSGAVMRRQAALHTATLALGAAAWLVGVVRWHLAGLEPALPFWFSFLVLTIAGERLELTRMLRPAPGARAAFIVLVAAVLATATVASAGDTKAPFGLSLALLALWLARYDLARRTVRGTGLTRFIAVALLAGYAWLALAGLLVTWGALDGAGASLRDTALHALGLGFVVSMVLGHAPVIVPALTGLRVAWTPAFYAPLLLLHASIALRAAGDLAADAGLMRMGGIGNAAALALFAATLLGALLRGASAHAAAGLRTGR
jgi:hypothetical protein